MADSADDEALVASEFPINSERCAAVERYIEALKGMYPSTRLTACVPSGNGRMWRRPMARSSLRDNAWSRSASIATDAR